jgi:hypothetical protein
MNEHDEDKREPCTPRKPHQVRLPGFIAPETERGLGDVLTQMTYAAGIRPCGGCQRRAARLNQWLVFTR